MPIQVHMWDAVGMLCGARPSRDAVALSPLLPLVAGRALGRGVPQLLRIAAMHALAACVGAEEIGSDADMLRALLCGKVRGLANSWWEIKKFVLGHHTPPSLGCIVGTTAAQGCCLGVAVLGGIRHCRISSRTKYPRKICFVL